MNQYSKIKAYLAQYGAKLISSEDKYINARSKIQIICSCGESYTITAMSYKQQCRCQNCSKLSRDAKHRATEEDILNAVDLLSKNVNINYKWIDGKHINKHSYLTFIDDDGYKYYTRLCVIIQNSTSPLQKFHPSNIYTIDNIKLWMSVNAKDYKLVSSSYANAKSKLDFICPVNHHFSMTRDNLFSGQRCPFCSKSKGEEKIKEVLSLYDTYFKEQYKYDDLRGIHNGVLSYDFYLPQYNLLIEYQGEFHDGNTRIQTEDNIKKQQEHDRRKRQYAIDHDIKLLEIWYYDFDNIENILTEALELSSAPPIKMKPRYRVS